MEDKMDKKPINDDNESSTPLCTNLSNIFSLDSRIGWPIEYPKLSENLHGWFRPGNKETLELLLNTEQKIVVELGSWLGASTVNILQYASNAIIFAVDIWSNQYFLNDDHYDKNDPAFKNILDSVSIYDQFLNNTQNYKWQSINDRESRGLIPMRMESSEALTILRDLKIEPDLIYIDASHHYDFVVSDISTCIEFFPNAILVGDDWDNTDVRKAVKDVAKKFNKEIFINGGTCWTFEKSKMQNLTTIKRANEEKEKEQRKRQKATSNLSFNSLLNVYQNKCNKSEDLK
eukprot:gene9207-12417_t